MKIIQKAANPSGAYPPMQDGISTLPDGYAIWPDELSTEDFYAYNGFVTLTIEETDGVPIVASYTANSNAWEAWKASLPEPVEPGPTAEERVTTLEQENKLLTKQVKALSNQLDFQEDCIAEMAGVVYA